MNQNNFLNWVAGVAICAAAFPAHAGALNLCNATPAELDAVYQAGSQSKIGDWGGVTYDGPRADDWLEKRVHSEHAEIMQQIWYATGDYTKAKSRDVDAYVFITTKYAGAKRKITQTIDSRCNDHIRNKTCREYYQTVSECQAHYTAMYAPLVEKIEKKYELSRSSYAQHEQARLNAFSKLNIPSAGLVIVGDYVRDPDVPLPERSPSKWPIEHANLRTERFMQAYRNPETLKPARGEFESSADYAARVKRADAEFEKQKLDRQKNTEITYRNAFERYLKAELALAYGVKIDTDSLKYDPDIEAFRVRIVFRNSPYAADFLFKVPLASAKQMKMLLEQEMSATSLRPWVAFELKADRLFLRGGILQASVGKDATVYPLVLAKPDSQGTPIGPIAATQYESKLKAELKAEELQAIQRFEARCRSISTVAAIKHPERYWLIMQMNGCL